MENKDLHNIIKNRINEYESPMDLDLEWNAFSEKKRRRKRFIWLLLLIGVCFCGAITYFGIQTVSEYTIVANSSHAEKELIESAKETTDLESAERLASSNKASAKQQEQIKIDSAVSKNKAENIALNAADQKAVVENATTTNDATQKITKVEPGDTKNNAISLFQQKVSKSSATLLLNSDKKDDEPIVKETNVASSKLKNNHLALHLLNIENEFSSLAYPKLDLDFEQLLRKEKREEEEQLNRRRMEIYTGMGLYTSKQVFKAKEEKEEAYQSLRQDSETNLESYNFDLGLNYFLSQKSFIGLGLSYTQWYDRFDFTHEKEKAYQLENVLVKIIRYQALDQVKEVYGDTTVIGSQTIKYKRFNQYTTISANLRFGYYFFQKNKFSIGASGGLIWNFSAKSKGTIASERSNEFVRANDNYRKSFGLGLSASLHLDYQLNQRWTIQLRPGANYFLSSITEKNDVLTARFYQLGLMAGIKYKL